MNLGKLSCALLGFILEAVWPFSSTGIAQTPAHAQQESLALVIGNAAYQHVQALENSRNDARAIAGALTDVGFHVIESIDEDRAQLEKKIAEFLDGALSSEIVILYYSGHGVQIDGKNYIAPIDASVPEGLSGLVAINPILDAIEQIAPENTAKIVILDACRNNPWNATAAAGRGVKGLAPITAFASSSSERLDKGTKPYFRIIAFATAADDVASDGDKGHSPYTRSLLRFIRQQGLEVGEMFRLVAGDVMRDTEGKQKPEYLVQTSRALYFTAPYATDCDRFAIEGQNFLGIPGVPFDDINTAKAVSACEAALMQLPDSPRIHNNLGRAYEKAERLQEAVTQYRLAADGGYPPAINALGIMYLSGCGFASPDVKRGVDLISIARGLGNLSARTALTGTDMLGSTEPAGILLIQRQLQIRGYFSGAIDGQVSELLRDAIATYQRSTGMGVGGFTLETAKALGAYEAVPQRFHCH